MIASVCSEKLKYNSYLFTIIIISSSNMEGDVSVWHLSPVATSTGSAGFDENLYLN